jgi:hypothetical protein
MEKIKKARPWCLSPKTLFLLAVILIFGWNQKRMKSGEMTELFGNKQQRLSQRQTSKRPPLVPKTILERNKDTMAAARQALLGTDDGGGRTCVRKACVFRDILLALPLEPPLLVAGKGDGTGAAGVKAMINPSIAFDSSYGECVVYGMGISGNSRFEQIVSQSCPRGVHAFDCTINSTKSSVFGMNFTFHPTCVGEPYDLSAGSVYANETMDSLHFETLPNIMKGLGHKYLDVLKLDVEGSEWKLLEDLPVSHDNCLLSYTPVKQNGNMSLTIWWKQRIGMRQMPCF